MTVIARTRVHRTPTEDAVTALALAGARWPARLTRGQAPARSPPARPATISAMIAPGRTSAARRDSADTRARARKQGAETSERRPTPGRRHRAVRGSPRHDAAGTAAGVQEAQHWPDLDRARPVGQMPPMSFEIFVGLSSRWAGLLPETMIVDGPGHLLRMV